MVLKLAKMLRRIVKLKMPGAIAKGLSPTAFLWEMKSIGLGYRKTEFLADWREAAGKKLKVDRYKYVRRDRRPPVSAMIDVEWVMEQEYMYKLRIFTREAEGAPLVESFVNIRRDYPLTPAEQEAAVFQLWEDRPEDYPEILERVQAFEAYRRVRFEV